MLEHVKSCCLNCFFFFFCYFMYERTGVMVLGDIVMYTKIYVENHRKKVCEHVVFSLFICLFFGEGIFIFAFLSLFFFLVNHL